MEVCFKLALASGTGTSSDWVMKVRTSHLTQTELWNICKNISHILHLKTSFIRTVISTVFLYDPVNKIVGRRKNTKVMYDVSPLTEQ